MEASKPKGIITDANVLIDYAKSAPQVLKLITQHIMELYVATPVLREVDQLSISDVKKLGILIVEPTLEQLVRANQMRETNPSLSGQDAVCFILAHDNQWSCLTNDVKLRSICSEVNIQCIWGLAVMLELVSKKVLTAEKAFAIATDIRSKNHYITDKTIEDFKLKLGL